MCERKLFVSIFFLSIAFSNFTISNGVSHYIMPDNCLLPPHPKSGWWSVIDNPSDSLQVPPKTILQVQCEETYKLDGCPITVCLNGTWFPPTGQCRKTCSSLFSTLTTKVTCRYREEDMENCNEPSEGTVAHFKCVPFHEVSAFSKSKSLCVGGKWSEAQPECFPVCGKSSVRKNPTLIVGGDVAERGEFPWHVAIFQVSDKELLCGGSLLSQTVVLTAAHCITDIESGYLYPKENYIVAAGKYYRKFEHPNETDYVQKSQILQMFVPEVYEGDNQHYLGDIAVLVTKKSFIFSNRVLPVCIDWNKEYEQESIHSGRKTGIVCGWGNTKQNSEPSSTLRSLEVPSIPRGVCREFMPDTFRNYLTYDKFCAGFTSKGRSVCGGDSGGGLVFEHDGRFYIAGIVSLSPPANDSSGGCNSQKYGVYTSVYNYTEKFILDKLEKYKPYNKAGLTTVRPTEISQTEPSTDKCTLPAHPESGRLTFATETSSTYSPGMYVSPGTKLKLTCGKNTTLQGEDTVVCQDNGWSGSMGKCSKMCPAVYSSSKMTVHCSYKEYQTVGNPAKENCTDTAEGAILRFYCTEYYELPSKYQPSYCLNGQWSPPVPQCNLECGTISEYVKPSTGILEKSEVFPWHVSIYQNLQNNTKNFLCGGTLISLNIVLTAALCVRDKNGQLQDTDRFTIAAGKKYVQFNSPPEEWVQLSSVNDIVISKEIKSLSDKSLDDLAIITVGKQFEVSPTVKPVCLDRQDEIFKKTVFSKGYMTAWDPNEKNSNQTKQYKMKKLNISSKDQVTKALKIRTIPKIGYANFVCRGDNGGGVVVKRNDKYILMGILTLEGEKCVNETGIAFFSRIDSNKHKLIFEVESRLSG